MRLLSVISHVLWFDWPGTLVTRLTVGSPTYAAARLNAEIDAPSSLLPTTPSGPGSRTVTGTLNAAAGWVGVIGPTNGFSVRRTKPPRRPRFAIISRSRNTDMS